MFRQFAWLAAAGFAVMAWALPAGASSYTILWTPRVDTNGDLDGRLLLMKDGSLVGASYGSPGNGMVFQLTPSGGSWTTKKLFGFNGKNGSGPTGGLVSDSSGALYGTTYSGGAHGDGTVFKLTLTGGVWKESVLYSFSGGTSDGYNPECDLVRLLSNGELIGTTRFGGTANNEGTVFSLTNSGGVWTEHVLYNIGGQPRTGIHRDSAGALYGTTIYGGAYNAGIVYKLAKSGKAWQKTKLHSFGASGDGSFPAGPLIEDSNGALYGTTSSGGANAGGTVFRIAPDGTETVLWSFTPGTDGNSPLSGLLMNSSGALYGTTDGYYPYMGTAFKLSPSGGSWTISVLHSFGSGNDGSRPDTALIEDSAGNLYGTTVAGGTYGYGTVFEITP